VALTFKLRALPGVASFGSSSLEPARGLGVFDASLIVVGSILGAGVFLVSGVVAGNVRSPAAFFGVWIMGGLIALAGALCNGELGGLFPRGGGEYVYLREAYGPSFGFLSGWTSFWIGFPGSIATLAWGFGHAMASLVGDRSGESALPIAIASVVLLTAVDALGLGPGRWTQNLLSGAKVLAFVVLFAIAILLPRQGPSHFAPFFGNDEQPSNLALALVPVFFAYSGWNAATYVAGEIRSPGKNLGRSLVLGTGLCVAIYVAVNVVYLRALSLPEMSAETDVARAAALRLSAPAATVVLSPLVAVAILSSLQATVTTGPRIYQAMARDGLFFASLGRIHPRSRVPVSALVVQVVVACVLLVSGTFERLLTFTTFAMLMFSTLTVGAVIVLRFRRRAEPRAFRTPGFPVVPIFFIAANTWVMWNVLAMGAREAIIGLGIVALGVPAYLWFRRTLRVGASST
jgi:basic amino acid/polyamine antiporter, APA family